MNFLMDFMNRRLKMKYEMQELKNINRLFNKFNKQVDEFIKKEKEKDVARNRE